MVDGLCKNRCYPEKQLTFPPPRKIAQIYSWPNKAPNTGTQKKKKTKKTTGTQYAKDEVWLLFSFFP